MRNADGGAPGCPRPLRPLRRRLRRRDADAARSTSCERAYARTSATRHFSRIRSTTSRTTSAGHPLYQRQRWSEQLGGAQILLKREDLNHTGAHKINNSHRPGAAGASAWARRASSPRPAPASTASPRPPWPRASAWSAWSTWARRTCERQALNVFRMKLLGATRGAGHQRARRRSRTPSTRRCATGSPTSRHLLHHRHRRRAAPVPDDGARLPARHRPRGRAQMLEATGRLPDAVIACVGGGSNAMGIFHPFLDDRDVRADRRRGGRARASTPAASGVADAPAAPACCTAPRPTCCRTTTARSSRPTRSRPASTTPASVPSTPSSRTAAAPSTSRSPTTRRSTRSTSCSPHRGHHPGARIRARGRRCDQARAHAAAATRSCWSTSPAAATRTWTPWPSARGSRSTDVRNACRRCADEPHRPPSPAAAAGRNGSFPSSPPAIRPKRDRAADARAGGGRRRRDRARRAVLRSDGRRPGDPARPPSARWRAASA